MNPLEFREDRWFRVQSPFSCIEGKQILRELMMRWNKGKGNKGLFPIGYSPSQFLIVYAVKLLCNPSGQRTPKILCLLNHSLCLLFYLFGWRCFFWGERLECEKAVETQKSDTKKADEGEHKRLGYYI